MSADVLTRDHGLLKVLFYKDLGAFRGCVCDDLGFCCLKDVKGIGTAISRDHGFNA